MRTGPVPGSDRRPRQRPEVGRQPEARRPSRRPRPGGRSRARDGPAPPRPCSRAAARRPGLNRVIRPCSSVPMIATPRAPSTMLRITSRSVATCRSAARCWPTRSISGSDDQGAGDGVHAEEHHRGAGEEAVALGDVGQRTDAGAGQLHGAEEHEEQLGQGLEGADPQRPPGQHRDDQHDEQRNLADREEHRGEDQQGRPLGDPFRRPHDADVVRQVGEERQQREQRGQVRPPEGEPDLDRHAGSGQQRGGHATTAAHERPGDAGPDEAGPGRCRCAAGADHGCRRRASGRPPSTPG